MFGRKKKAYECKGVIVAALLKTVGIYFGVVGVRLQLMSYKWLSIEAMLFYLLAVLLFGWGRHIHTSSAK
jgi:hypothetical protein